jgi:hypothetical protein
MSSVQGRYLKNTNKRHLSFSENPLRIEAYRGGEPLYVVQCLSAAVQLYFAAEFSVSPQYNCIPLWYGAFRTGTIAFCRGFWYFVTVFCISQELLAINLSPKGQPFRMVPFSFVFGEMFHKHGFFIGFKCFLYMASNLEGLVPKGSLCRRPSRFI